MADPTATPTPTPATAAGGRRAGANPQRTWSPLVLAVVGVPVLIAVALATLDPTAAPVSSPAAPKAAPLSRIDLVCPSPLGSAPSLSLTQADVPRTGATPAQSKPADSKPADSNGAGATEPGRVVVGSGTDGAPLSVPIGSVVSAPPETGPVVVSGSGTSAPGLSAALSQDRPRAVTGCASPQPDGWFSGLGAGPTHGSVIELINPDDANAVADITIFSEEGVLEVPELRGIAVPGNASTRLALAEILPRRGQLGARVTVSRGRLGVSVSDRNDELGAGDVSADWLPAQAAPATTNVLLGLPDAGQHQLVVTNPGADEAVVSVQIITPSAPFVPAGVAELQVPPESVGVVSLSDVISDAVGAEGPDGLGLLVEATTPVATSLRSLVAGDLSFTVPTETVREAWQLVPDTGDEGRTRLVLWGGTGSATGTVRILDRSGVTLVEREIALAPLAADKLKLPDGAAIVELVSDEGLAAAISISGKRGSVVVALGPVQTNSLIPDVRPTLR